MERICSCARQSFYRGDMLMKMKHAFFRILLLMIMLPPPFAHPASSDSFPWSNTPNNNPADLSAGVRRDAYGALRDANMPPDTMPAALPMKVDSNMQPGSNMETGIIAPGGTVSGSGIAQGNVGPTQSGPGAVGLFTPNSPGNAAAFNAQMNGGLAGSPIVDGNGANIHVTVPVATPSVVPSYEQFSNGLSDDVRSFSSNGRTRGAPMNAPITARRAPISLQSPINSRLDVNGVPVRMVNFSAPNAVSRRLTGGTYRAPLVVRTTRTPVRHQTSSDAVKTIGEVTGSITYADGQKTIFGTHGNAAVNAKNATMSLPDGKVIPLRIAGPEMSKVAQKNQVPL
jgi:hypothetical protein